MELKTFFDQWAHSVQGQYDRRQWLLSKWEVCEGVQWSDAKIDVMLKTIKDGLGLERQHLLADLGCGGGWIAERLRPNVRRLVGVDFSRDMLDIARTSGGGTWVQGVIGQLPFRAGAFDRALSYFVFLNFTDDRFVEKALLDIFRVVRPGGRALIGQLPDADGSKEYDRAKSEYLEYCRSRMAIGERNDAGTRAPLRLFRRENLRQILAANGVRHEFQPAFNPFYRDGVVQTVPWRFDLVMYKD